jgi:cell division protein FtsW
MTIATAALRGLKSQRLRISIPLVAVLICTAVVLMLLLPLDGPYPWWLLVLAAAGFIGWYGLAPGAQTRDQTILPIVAALCALGILVITRIDSQLGSHQAIWLVVGLALVIAGQRYWIQYRRLEHIKYSWVVASIVIFVLLQLFGHEVNGARLWFRIGIFSIQPVEIIKLFMVFFMAAYLAENGEAIAALPLSALGANLRLLGPLLLGWGVSMLTLALQHDVGMACLFLGIFLAMLYVASRRVDIVILAAVVFALGLIFVASHFTYVHARIDAWLHPWSDPLGHGYQPEQAYFSLATGGLIGAGYHLGHPFYIPDAATDYVFAAWSEEFGLLGGLALLGLYLALVVRGLAIAFSAADKFTALLATGFAATLGIQVFVIVGGVIGLFPLTGITLPFFSYGGSSMVANLLMINMLWTFSGKQIRAS